MTTAADNAVREDLETRLLCACCWVRAAVFDIDGTPICEHCCDLL